MLYTTKIPSPAGKITLASDGIHLIGLWFDGQQYFAHTIKEETKENPGLGIRLAGDEGEYGKDVQE